MLCMEMNVKGHQRPSGIPSAPAAEVFLGAEANAADPWRT